MEQSQTARRKVWQQAAEFIDHHGIGVFRSALFYASLMVLIEHSPILLEWLNIFMFEVLSGVPKFRDKDNQTTPVQTLVFIISEELFEAEFQSRSPIDRLLLKKYLTELIRVFPKIKVLAIDYDLSPNGYDLSRYKQTNECVIADETEQNDQNALDDFLVRKDMQVVLIKHIPVKNQSLCKCKIRWEQKLDAQGVWFGQPDLLHYGLLGPIMRYAEDEDSFPAVVLAAKNAAEGSPAEEDKRLQAMRYTCEDSDLSSRKFGNRSNVGDKELKWINFFPKGALRLYGLHARLEEQLGKLNDFEIYKTTLKEQASNVNVIFFGGSYGRDDIYSTSRGEQPGVAVQAYTYYSLIKPVDDTPWLAWGFDIIIGSFAGLIFHRIWRQFHNSRRDDRFASQVGWTALNFIFLMSILVVLVWGFAQLLHMGIWLSPGPMFIGLFIDSYVATATATGTRDIHSIRTPDRFTAILRQLFGMTGHHVSKWDLLVSWILKIAAFWMIIGIAVYLLFLLCGPSCMLTKMYSSLYSLICSIASILTEIYSSVRSLTH